MLNPQETISKKRVPILFAMSFFLVSCFQEDPSGRFEGEIKDWVHEVFEASLTTQGNLCQIEVILRQLPDGLISRLTFQHPKMQEVVRTGKWKVEDGYKSIFFEDGKQPSEYFLIKKGARFAFQTKDGLSNDDGSPILMMRNEGKSRKASYPIKMFFEEEDNVRVESFGKDQVYSGTWQWGGDQIAVSVKRSVVVCFCIFIFPPNISKVFFSPGYAKIDSFLSVENVGLMKRYFDKKPKDANRPKRNQL